MSSREIIEKGHKKAEAALYEGKMDGLDEVYTLDAIVYSHPYPPIRGLDAIKQTFIGMRTMFTIKRIEWEEMIEQGNTVAERYTFHITLPNNKELMLKRVAFFHIKNGKIAEELVYCDWSQLLEQMGGMPKP
jgi:ketosteroid isomerase-like protein